MPASAARATPTPTAAKVTKNWRGVPACAHFVQLYRTEDELIGPLAAFVSDGIWQSERVVIIATPAHRDALQRALRERGVDLDAVAATRQLRLLDASDTLAEFMVDGRPDRRRFMQCIGEVVRHAIGGGRKLRAFGEMVALLWQRDNRAAAIELEQLWNDLSREQPFSLFCAYPAAEVDRATSGLSLDDICRVHDHVIPALLPSR